MLPAPSCPPRGLSPYPHHTFYVEWHIGGLRGWYAAGLTVALWRAVRSQVKGPGTQLVLSTRP